MIQLKYDNDIFVTALKVSLIIIVGMLASTIMSFIFEGYFFKLFSWHAVSAIMINIAPLFLIFLIPLYFASFIRPLTTKKKDRFIQGALILFLSAIIYFSFMKKILIHDLHRYHGKNSEDTAFISTLIFLFVNLIIYLPMILKIEENK